MVGVIPPKLANLSNIFSCDHNISHNSLQYLRFHQLPLTLFITVESSSGTGNWDMAQVRVNFLEILAVILCL